MPSHGPPVSTGQTGCALSVVVVVGPLRDRAAGCLASLLAQDALAEMEILLVDLRPDLALVPGGDHPAVQILHLSQRSSFAEARLAAVHAARGAAIALVEEHCRALPGWARAVIDAHARGWTAVASEMHSANPGVGRADINAVMNYGLFAPPMRRGEGEIAPPFHTSFLRQPLLDLGAALEEAAFSDVGLWHELRRRGGRLWQEPAARLAHINETALFAPLTVDFNFHRFWVGYRMRAEGWSWCRKAAAVLLFPAYPLYFLWLFWQRLRERNPSLVPLLCRHLAHVYLRQLGPAAGQAVGILLGAGHAAERFTYAELSEPRATEPRRAR